MSEKQPWSVPLEPRQDVIIVEAEKDPVSKGGILLPSEVDTRFATVLAAGPGRWEDGVFIPNDLKPGDRILRSKATSGGEPITIEGKDYLLLRAGDVAAKVSPHVAAVPMDNLDMAA